MNLQLDDKMIDTTITQMQKSYQFIVQLLLKIIL